MKMRKLPPSSVLSEVRASTSSQTTASEGAPRAARSARSAALESCESICSSAIEPSRWTPSSFRSAISTLASSRAMSQRITSPAGLRAAPGRTTRLQAAGEVSSRSTTFPERSDGTTIRRWTMTAQRIRAWEERSSRLVPMLTDYHLHLRPDDGDLPPSATSPARTSTAIWPPPRRPGSRSWASPSTSTASARRSTSGAIHSGRATRTTTSTPTASSSAARRCGSASSATSSPAPKPAPRSCSRRATSTTSSAPSTSSATRRSTIPAGTSGRAAAIRTRSGAATSRPWPTAPAPASSTSSPTPTWSRSGAARGRCRTATCASFYEPAVEAIAESGIAVEVSTAGLRKPVGELYPARGFAEMCVEAGAPFALSSDAHLPEHVGFAYDRAVDFLDDLGVGEICVFEQRQRRLAPLGSRVG